MALPEYTEYPEFNHLAGENEENSGHGGFAEFSGLNAGGGESGSLQAGDGEAGAEDSGDTSAGSTHSAFLKKQKKKLISQAMAFTTTAVVAVTTVTLFPVGANTRVQQVSEDSAVVSTRFLVIGDRENKEAQYRLYEEDTRELLEQGAASLSTKNLDFDRLEPGKTYRLQILYEDKVIRSMVFNTLQETEPSEPVTEPPKEPETAPAKVPTEPVTEAETEAETEPETEAETEVETEAETEAPAEPETAAPAEPETEAPTTAPAVPLTEPQTEPETAAATLWNDGSGQVDAEIHITQIQEGNFDYTTGTLLSGLTGENPSGAGGQSAGGSTSGTGGQLAGGSTSGTGGQSAGGSASGTEAGPTSLPQPSYLKCSYGSAAYPFYPILEELSWEMPERAKDAKLFLEWTVTTEAGGKGTELHRSDLSQGSLHISNVAANVSTPIRNIPGVVAFTPCYVYRGCLVKLYRQIITLPYLSPWIDFEASGEKSGLNGLDTLERYGLTMKYDGIVYEKQSGAADEEKAGAGAETGAEIVAKAGADGWQDAAADFAAGRFDADTDYRITYTNVVVTNEAYGASVSVPDVTATAHHGEP